MDWHSFVYLCALARIFVSRKAAKTLRKRGIDHFEISGSYYFLRNLWQRKDSQLQTLRLCFNLLFHAKSPSRKGKLTLTPTCFPVITYLKPFASQRHGEQYFLMLKIPNKYFKGYQLSKHIPNFNSQPSKMIESFINYLEYEKRSSSHTVLAYRKDLEKFQEFCGTAFEKEDIALAEHAEIRAWVIDLVEQNLNPTSVNRKIATLRSFYKFLLRSSIITKDPTYKIRTLKTPKRLPEFVQEVVIDKVLDELVYKQDFDGQRDRMVMEFLYLTGVRLSELLNLKWKDINLHEGTVKVLGKRNKERIIPVTNHLKENIISYKKEFTETFLNVDESDYFIVINTKEQAYPMKIYRIVRYYLDLFAQTTKRSPHLLRHTFATHLLNKGADLNAVKDLLGHANLAATQVYTHNSMEKLKAVFEQAHPKA